MIVSKQNSNMFDSKAQTLTIPVNTEGVMGAGLALYAKLKYPTLLRAYKEACRRGIFKQDGFFVFDVNAKKKILCIPTKIRWRDNSKLEWIDESLYKFAINYSKHGITSLAVPGLGCGRGNLEWEDVFPIIEKHLGPIDIPVELYLP